MTLQIWDLYQNSNGLSKRSKKMDTSSDIITYRQTSADGKSGEGKEEEGPRRLGMEGVAGRLKNKTLPIPAYQANLVVL